MTRNHLSTKEINDPAGHLFPSVIVIFAFVFGYALCVAADPPATQPTEKITIVLVGDSTMTDKAGWGPGFRVMLKDDVELINASRGGRSSRTFRQEGSWDKVMQIKADYVLIQFGHNDEPGTDRSTDIKTEFPNFMRQYVEDARAKGMKPILITPLVRRQFKEDGAIHSSLTQHAQIVREIAKEMNVPLIDLHDHSLAVCNAMGKDACTALLSVTKPGGFDGTHLTPAGASLMGAIVATELKTVVPELAPYLRSVPASSETPTTAPTTKPSTQKSSS
jgi:pectinesterase